MALVVILLMKVFLGALARSHTQGIKHWSCTVGKILALAKLMVKVLASV